MWPGGEGGGECLSRGWVGDKGWPSRREGERAFRECSAALHDSARAREGGGGEEWLEQLKVGQLLTGNPSQVKRHASERLRVKGHL